MCPYFLARYTGLGNREKTPCINQIRRFCVRRRFRPRRHVPTAPRKAAAVQRLIRGESLEAVFRDLGVPAHGLSEWRDRFLAGVENALKARESSPQDDEVVRLTASIGKTTVENELLRDKIGRLEDGAHFHLQRSTK